MLSPTDSPATFLADSVRAFLALGPVPGAPAPQTWWEPAVRQGVLAPVLEVVGAQDDELGARARQMRRERTAREMRVAVDLAFLASTLDAAGITWAALKGPVLSHEVFQRPGVRDYVDLDALVAPDALRPALDALRRGGAQVLGVDWHSVEWSTAAEAPVRLPHGTTLDLHWTLINRHEVRRAYPDVTRAVLARTQRVRVLGHELSAPDDLDFCLHVMMHACLDGCAKLRHLLDAQQCLTWLSARGHTAEAFAARVREAGGGPAVRTLLTRVAAQIDPAWQRWAAIAGTSTAWTRAVDAVDERRRAGGVASPVGRKMHRHTCPTTALSLRAVGSRQLVRLAEVWEARPGHTSRGASESGLADWLRYAEAHRSL